MKRRLRGKQPNPARGRQQQQLQQEQQQQLFAATPACPGTATASEPLHDEPCTVEAAREELRELQQCGLHVNLEVLATGRRLACGGEPVAEPTPSLLFGATPASYVPYDEEAAAEAELIELELCGLRVRRS